MKMVKPQFLNIALLAASASAAPPPRMAYDLVPSLASNVPGDSYLYEFMPALEIKQGCVPFPAATIDGHISAGLAPSSLVLANHGCDVSKGQTYVRAGDYLDHHTIMYAWFFPKKQKPGVIYGVQGHAYAWSSVVIIIDKAGPGAIASDLYLSHDDGAPFYQYRTWPKFGNEHPDIAKQYSELDLTVGDRTRDAVLYPLINWDDMTDAMRNAFNNMDQGDLSSLQVPFSDKNWDHRLLAAFNSGPLIGRK